MLQSHVNFEFCGRGIASEATKALALSLSKHQEVQAYFYPENRAAHKVAINSSFDCRGLSMHKNFGFEGILFIYNYHTTF
ncbi:MAG: hypothetical protein ACFB02_20030 [Mastigocoleus sp.]|mgnify:CR=1 FL=1